MAWVFCDRENYNRDNIGSPTEVDVSVPLENRFYSPDNYGSWKASSKDAKRWESTNEALRFLAMKRSTNVQQVLKWMIIQHVYLEQLPET